MTMNLPWPADAVERRPLTSVKHYSANARTHSPEQVAQIAASIREFGFTIPLLVDAAGELIAGHGRALAAQEIGLELVPVMVARGWTQKQIKAYRLADNQLALNAGWDVKLLAAELETLQDMAALIGFSESELRRLGRLTGNPGLTDPDEAPALPDVPTSKAGDLWLCGQHRILCGDACNAQDVERLFSGVKPNLMVTDPPYGVDYDPHWRAEAGVNNNRKKMGEVVNDERADWRQAYDLFPGAVAYVWHAGKYASEVQASLEASGFQIRSQIIWAKDRFALSRGDYHWQHEPCWYAVKQKGNWCGDRSQSTLWTIPSRDDSGHGHSTQKPVEAMRRPMQNNSSAGQAVYDPFVGSGTTMIAAEMEARCALCLEINPAYVDVAVTRWQDFTGEKARLDGGPSFDDVAGTIRP
ncbi:DNA methylase [Sinorhizobium medicae]|uniref:Methyltransferase n=1 Tax=Sinorhizobium medicae TaxID=110321 RepID=A0ABX4TPQ5_9HYPH|nr:DNA methyltransferase [Sinorhizobium meliloti]PLU04549.1 DNA methylase [Sinorhizobium medicae]PLU08421.1 DNA methylase [Sinorhizobium medicae]PLU20173.1 DNA methylase [Sinorhizobium medicae]PLU81190.1 DNA methylase [Sinorhizobium medicae]RVN05302.1 site-specific DNA-methyltransferase [Sinorhizobium meliloti]